MDIYKITNIITNKIYIGKTKKDYTSRFAQHLLNAKKGVKSYLYSAIRKYGDSNFYIEKIDECQSLDELNLKEIYWISYYNSTDPKIGYNIALGGDGGWINDSPEHHKKVSDMGKNRRGHASSIKGKIYISKDDICKTIDKNELDYYQSLGWIRYNCKAKKPGFIFITNRNINKQILPEELDYYLKQGFIKGRNYSPNKDKVVSDETRKKMSMSAKGIHKGKIHITNGSEDHMINENEFEQYKLLGYWRGRRKFKKN